MAMHVEEKVIDLFHSEQLEEQFLREVNAEGMVSVSQSFGLPFKQTTNV